MSKRQKKQPFGLKWKNVRVFPMDKFTNAMELEEKARDRMTSLEEWMDADLRIQSRIFRGMGCDEEKSKQALKQMREAYESSQI